MARSTAENDPPAKGMKPARRPSPRSLMRRLTPRQREIAMCVWAGMPDKTIAYGLKISLGTLRVHLSRIFRKLRLDSRVKLAVLWEQAYPRSRQ